MLLSLTDRKLLSMYNSGVNRLSLGELCALLGAEWSRYSRAGYVAVLPMGNISPKDVLERING